MTAAVIFDWRGTLVTTLTERQWVAEALSSLGRDAGAEAVDGIVAAIGRASGAEDRLDAPGVDSDAALHRSTYLGVFTDAGLDDELAEALYAVESDPRHNRFASDVDETLRGLRDRGVGIAVVSDIHVDLRPAFADAGLGGLVDVFTLSFEQGVQKPDPRMFCRTLEALGVAAGDALMVGDRSGPDGAAVEQGIPTLLLPPLTDVADRRLHRVLQLCPVMPVDGAADGHPGAPAAGARLVVGDGDAVLDETLSRELDAYNVPAAGAGPQRELTVQARDDDGVLVAGLSGWTWGTCAGVAMLWVREDRRRDGWGGRLLAAAEREASARGCRQLVLSSFTFQAPEFYRRHGYVETGRTEGLPLEGTADVHFRKDLTG